MNLYRKLSISIFITSLLLCGNALAKPTEVKVVNIPDVMVVEIPFVHASRIELVHEQRIQDNGQFTVPAGMTLIIEYVSAYNSSANFLIQETQFRVYYHDGSQYPGTSMVFGSTTEKARDGGGAKVYLPVPEGSAVSASINRNNNNDDATYHITITGRLIPTLD